MHSINNGHSQLHEQKGCLHGGPFGGKFAATANMDQLDLDIPLLNMDRDTAPEVEAHRDGHTSEGRATADRGNADRADRTDQSNVLAAVRNLAANRNRARCSAKPAGSLLAQHRPLEELVREGLVLERRTGKPQPAQADLGRGGTAGKPLGLER